MKKVRIFAARFRKSGKFIDNIERSQRGKVIETKSATKVKLTISRIIIKIHKSEREARAYGGCLGFGRRRRTR